MMQSPSRDTYSSLTHGERWFVDGFAVMTPPGGVMWQLCDMTQAHAAVLALRERGIRATYTHLIIRATALALRRYPEAHQLLCGYTRVRPARIDIGLSVAGQTSYAPVMVIEGADDRSLVELVAHLATAVPATREKETRDLAGMRRTGWIIPIGLFRRFILRLLARTFWFRRRLIGTYQITVVPDCDMVAPMVFYSGCALGVGRICDRVLPIDGRPEVRKSAWLCVPIDHRAMDGRIGATLMQTIRQILESREFLAEAGVYEDRAPSAESPEPLLAPLAAAARKGPATTGV